MNKTNTYVSTTNTAGSTLADAVMNPYANDGSLYLPAVLPQVPAAFFRNFADMAFDEIAFVLANLLIGGQIGANAVKDIVAKAFNFPVPMVQLSPQLHVAELFHGRTLSCKDFGARFMAALIPHLRRLTNRPLHVIASTAGNTGAAVADAFSHVPGVEVYILYPRQSTPRALEAQYLGNAPNIHPLRIDGNADVCRILASQLAMDSDLRKQADITTANSVNIATLLPRMFSLFYAVSRIDTMRKPLTVAIPAGSLGHLCAAVMARKMGLPLNRIIACENANSLLTDTMHTGVVPAHRRTVVTLAPSADRAVPSNLSRLIALCGGTAVSSLRDNIVACSVDDAGIMEAVNQCYFKYGYTIDPHTALAYAGIMRHAGNDDVCLVPATAHPAKSLTAMSAITGRAMDLPLQLTRYMRANIATPSLPPTYAALRSAILAHN